MNKEGWTFLWNSRKWHYFRDYRSLCGGFMILATPKEGFEKGNNESKDNCAKCKKKILAELEKQNGRITLPNETVRVRS